MVLHRRGGALTPSEERELAWPDLPLQSWADTCMTLHRWTQVVGKVRLACTPWINHSWHVTLYVTAQGLTTGPMALDQVVLQIDLDFTNHELVVSSMDGRRRGFALEPLSVADFYDELMEALDALGFGVAIVTQPNEVADITPLDSDHDHAAYDADAANKFWRMLASSDRVLRRFRSRFLGKSSPVHFFWGSFDLAVTRFSGRLAPVHPGGVPNLPDPVTREAYSHEVSSAGFWPGTVGGPVDYPAFYSYAYPTPAGFAQAPVDPASAFFHDGLGEFVLPYDAVRSAPSPDEMLLEFLQSTYEAAASLGRWDRAALERAEGPPSGIARLSTPLRNDLET
ncbi:MAG TPA: DUF5996 family protein [Thermoanaerobaculia bacterium]|jgi:hypothetical protein|nr:DUF5996 family protein [Thermoanaerobaculia bacterium]